MTDSIFPAGAEPILPILPLRNSVLVPATVVPVNVGRARSVRLIEEACADTSPVDKPQQLDEKQRAGLKQMRAIVTSSAKDLGVDPALLASRRELEKLIRAQAIGAPVPERFLGWRKSVITDQLLAV